MAARSGFTMPRRGTLIRGGSFVAIIGLMVTGAIVYDGFDVKQAPLQDDTIWAINADATTSGTARYARINAQLGELETVEPVSLPSDIVQTDSSVVVFSESFASYGQVDLADPQDFKEEAEEMASTPSGTEKLAAHGDYIGYLSNAGRVSVSSVVDGVVSTPVVIDPLAADAQADAADEADEADDAPAEDVDPYVSAAIAIGTNGVLYSLSPALDSVLAWDLATNRRISEDAIDVPATMESPQLTVVGDDWLVFDGVGEIWTAATPAGASVNVGEQPGALVQSPSEKADAAYIASPDGLYAITLTDAVATPAFTREGLGVAAAPRVFDGVTYAAWLPSGAAIDGVLWSSETPDEPQVLDVAGVATSGTPALTFRTHGSTMILNDDSNGWVWTIKPRVGLVPSSQLWNIAETSTPSTSNDDVPAEDVLEAKPPVAVDDDFGVRAGQLITLPVLLNDSDPNRDNVLTIVPDSLTGLDEAFGELSVTSNDQRIVIRVKADAPASASFEYRITDGITPDDPKSHAKVRLSIKAQSVETPPLWCNGDPNACEWPSIQVTPGGSGSANVLEGWVDPEGDAVYVKSVAKKNLGDPGSVAVALDGTVYYQHPDANDLDAASVPIAVVVADALGEETERDLIVEITDQPTLASRPFAVTTHVDEQIIIDPAPYISGVAGVITITHATAADAAADVAVAAGNATLSFESANPGTYSVTFDVQDELSATVASTVRVTVLADDATGLTTAPITVFVRPKLDTTVDVFSAVANPGNKLLLLTEAESINNGDNALFKAIVGHGLLRVKGSTFDGQPGVLGVVNYTVTDGGTEANGTVRGTVTVVLQAETDPQTPIARNDSIVVRAGAQVDVPVIANDISADGNALVLDPAPAALSSTAETGLSFVSGSQVRLLAPTQEGEYTITYRVYSAGSPSLSDTATIKVTVIPLGENQPPSPRALEGRVVSGQSVAIPFDDYGIDPDGDSVILDRVLSQPEQGTATIAARGGEIIYTSFGDYAGPDEFSYQVKDSSGATASATVRIGVISTDSETGPITFTDYVEVQQGTTSRVDVFPADNDIDPLGGGRPVLSTIEPDAPTGTSEYTELESLISATDLDAGKVTLVAGQSTGTKSFRYEVTRTNGLSPAFGYIVMKVIPEVVPDTPRVLDSYVAIDDRATFPVEGIDVLSGKVSWLSGDSESLTMKLWNPPAGYTATGRRISGPLPADSLLLAFQVSGASYLDPDTTVTSYGFLVIPGKNDLILSLKPSVGQQSVAEDGTVSFDMRDLVSVPPGESLVVDNENVRSVKRENASCDSAAAATSVLYTAGRSAPWTDFCVVPVKINGQDEFTPIQVPIKIIPNDPVPALASTRLLLTPDPNLPDTEFDLASLVSWEDREDPANLEFAITGPSAKFFEFSATSATTFSVRALSSAPPGTEGTVTAVFTGTYAAISDAAVITLEVGETPKRFPHGSEVRQSCEVGDGAGTCKATVVFGTETSGEFNYFQKDGDLKVVSPLSAGTCPGVTFKISGTAVSANWAEAIDGVKCEVSFAVIDPAGLTSSGERNGKVYWEFKGKPRAPASITQTAYDDGVIQLAVDPGESTRAFPELTGFVVLQDDKKEVASCTVAGVCDAISGLVNLDKHVYSAYAVNDQGRSLSAVQVEAWSYAAPALGKVTVSPAFDAARTTLNRGVARISIAGSQDSVTRYAITGSDTEVARTGALTEVVLPFDVGNTDITITPITDVGPPAAKGPQAKDEERSFAVKVAGLPSLTAQGNVSVDASGDTATVTVNGLTVKANASEAPIVTILVAYQVSTPTCAVDASGANPVISSADGVQSAPNATSIGGLAKNTNYFVAACSSNGFGFVMSDPQRVFTAADPGRPAGISYSVAPDHDADGLYKLTISDADIAAVNAAAPLNYQPVWKNYDPETKTAAISGSDPNITVKYCTKAIAFFQSCGDEVLVPAAATSYPFQMRVKVYDNLSCVSGNDLGGWRVDGVGAELGAVVVDSAKYYRSNGFEITGVDPPNHAPSNARKVDNVQARIVFTDGRINPFVWPYLLRDDCGGTVDDPEPTPEPTVAPTVAPTVEPTPGG